MTKINSQYQQLGNEALDNYDKSARPRFQGNQSVPIEANISPGKLVNALQMTASGSSGVHTQSKEMLESLAEQYNGWNIAAGVHQGGLGGGGRAADPNKHITLSTGHHVQLGNKDEIKNITGNGITPRLAGRPRPSATRQEIANLQARHGLNERQAGKVQLWRRRDGLTENQAVEKLKSGGRSRS